MHIKLYINLSHGMQKSNAYVNIFVAEKSKTTELHKF